MSKSRYSLTPELKAAIARLPIIQQITVRAKLHYHLKALSATDNAIADIQNRLDCGLGLADYITGGKLSRLEAELETQQQAIQKIVEPLLHKS